MYNKKVLSEATKNLNSTKAPAKKKNIIVDPKGQWEHPGKDTRIPGNDITMEGVPYPVWAQPNVGPGVMMQPGQNYQFPKADYVDEFPQNEDYYEDDLTEDEINELKAGGYIVEDISVPQLTKAQYGITTVPTQEETQFAQRSTKAIPYADKEITLPEVTVTPAGYKGPTNLNNPNALLSSQQRTLAQGKGPLQTGKVNSFKKTKAQTKSEKKIDQLIRSGTAAEMYPDYYNQQPTTAEYAEGYRMVTADPGSLRDFIKTDDNLDQNIEDAKYRIWKKNEERAYQNAGYGDRLLNELQSFASDPLSQVYRAVTGKRSLMGQGYRDIAPGDYDDTRFYDRVDDRNKSELGSLGAAALNIGSGILNIFNPMQSGALAGNNIRKGNYLKGAANVAEGLLAGSSLTKSNTLKKLFNTQMAVQSAQGIPETINTFLDPNIDPITKTIFTVMDLGFLKSGLRDLKPGLKSAGQGIKALAPKQTLPILSYKKGGERKFSRSLEAKNRLFAESPLLKKKKSKKRKIFDPNAKYYQYGGAQLPEDYSQFTNFNQTLPSNLQDPEYQYGNPDQYDLYGMLQEKQLGGQQYRYKGRANAVYTKDTKGNWLIKSPGTKMQWQRIDDPTGKRTTLLNKQAIPLDNTEKVSMNESMMNKVYDDRYTNKIKNLRNELKVYNNELKYEPQFDVPVSESTRVDTGLLPASVQKEKQNAALQKRTKAERMKSIEAYLKFEQEKQKQAAYDRSPEGVREAALQAKLDSYNRSSGRAQPADWFWTLPLAAAKAPQIFGALVEANALTDIPLTIGNVARPGITIGNAMRAHTVGTSVAGLPQAFTDLNSAKTIDQKITATRDLLHRIIGSTPLVKWENSIYNKFATPLTFADNTRKYFSGEELNPLTTGSNILRTAAALSGRKEGGEMYEDEIDDETRKQLEALGYIIEDLD